MKSFKPFLAPNQSVNLDEINYPILASYKLDGIRCIFKNGEMLSRSLKQIQNKQLQKKFQPLKDYSKEFNVILDGEIYAHRMTFQEITRYVMTQDFEDKKSIKKFGEILEIPEVLKFYMFDCIANENYNNQFINRNKNVTVISICRNDLIIPVIQTSLNSKSDIENFFEDALKDGYEGLILKDPNGHYKCGRGTLKEGLVYKIKNFRTFDSKIKDVIQATVVNPSAEKEITELGYSKTSKKKDDRILINKAAAFLVEYKGNDLKVVIALTDKEKEEIWDNKENYINKIIEYKGMLEGALNVPRHPVFVRYRNDKD